MTQDSTIPAKNAQIHWSKLDRPSPSAVDRVLVFDRSLPWEDDLALECSLGACCADWLDSDEPRSTPEGVYVNWLEAGFRTNEAHIAALEELAKIEGCGWARVMAEARRKALPEDAA